MLEGVIMQNEFSILILIICIQFMLEVLIMHNECPPFYFVKMLKKKKHKHKQT